MILLSDLRPRHSVTKEDVTITMEYVAGGSFASISVRRGGKREFSHTDMNSWKISQMFAAKCKEYGIE